MKIIKILILVLSMVALSFAGAQAFSLYDGSGHKLGTFVYENTVYVSSWKKIVWFNTDPTSPYFGNIYREPIYFTGTNCTGDAYVQYYWLSEYVFQNGTELWTGSNTNSFVSSLSIQSKSDEAGNCSANVATWSYGWPVEPFTSKKMPFKLPITFPLSVGP
jgi:hypothetical protein